MPSWMERLQSTVRSGRRTSTNSCSREVHVGRRSSSHDFGGDSRMIRRSSAEVTGVTVDRLKAVGGKTGGEEPSVAFRMSNTLVVNEVRYSCAEKDGTLCERSARPRGSRALNVAHNRFGWSACVAILQFVVRGMKPSTFRSGVPCWIRGAPSCRKTKTHPGISRIICTCMAVASGQEECRDSSLYHIHFDTRVDKWISVLPSFETPTCVIYKFSTFVFNKGVW